MIVAFVMGFLSSVAVMVVLARLGLKKCMGYPVFLDVFVTVAMSWLLYGSYTGMVAAVFGGLCFSILVTLYRKICGYARLERKGLRFVWVYYEGQWTGKFSRVFKEFMEGTHVRTSI